MPIGANGAIGPNARRPVEAGQGPGKKHANKQKKEPKIPTTLRNVLERMIQRSKMYFFHFQY